MKAGHLKKNIPGLDEIDLKILQELQKEARLSIREVATRVNLSPSPTQERIRRMERDGIITQYGALLNYKKINRAVIVLCQVTMKDHSKPATQKFIDSIISFPEVVSCYDIAGDFDFILKVATESIEAYHDFFSNRLSQIPNTSQMRSTFVLDIVKDTHILV